MKAGFTSRRNRKGNQMNDATYRRICRQASLHELQTVLTVLAFVFVTPIAGLVIGFSVLCFFFG